MRTGPDAPFFTDFDPLSAFDRMSRMCYALLRIYNESFLLLLGVPLSRKEK